MVHGDRQASKDPYDQMNVDDRGIAHASDIDFVTSDHALYQEGHQLQLWVHETSNRNITVAERLEKANWAMERLERL
jgi:hypothetical protein